MNKKLKNCLVGLLGTMALVGCGAKPPAGPQTLNAQQKNDAFVTLKSHSAKPLYDTTSSTGVGTTINADIGIEMEADFSKSGLSSADIEDLKYSLTKGFAEIDMSIGAKSVMGYRSDNTGYCKDFVKFMGASVLTSQEVTKKVGSEYINYYYDTTEDTKTASKVDANYASKNYMLTSGLSSLDEGAEGFDIALFQDLLDSINENENYTEFALGSTDIAKELLLMGSQSEYSTNELVDLDSINAQAKVEMTVTDGVYDLTLDLDIDDYSLTQDGQTVKMDMSSGLSIKFDSTKITDMRVSVDIETETTMKSADRLDGSDYGVVFTDNNTITQVCDLELSMSVTPNEFSDSLVNGDFSQYTGTGEAGAIENKVTNAQFVCTNLEGYNLNSSLYEIQFGSDIITSLNALLEEDYTDLSDLGGLALYWDEACQNPVLATDKMPSYDATLYFKLVPKTGEAYIRVTEESSSSLWTFPEYLSASAGETLVFADYVYSDIIEIKVDGVVVAAESIQIEAGRVYDIVITTE